MNKNAENVATVHTDVLDKNKNKKIYERDIDEMPQIVMQRKNEKRVVEDANPYNTNTRIF